MKRRFFVLIGALALAGLLVGGCNLPTATPAFIPPPNVPNLVPHVPVANTIVYMLGSPVAAAPGVSRTIHVWAYTSQFGAGESSGPTGLSSVNITYGGLIGTVALDPNQPSSHGTIQWTPPAAPADYYIQADTGGLGIPNGRSVLGATLCVNNEGITIGELIEPGTHICAMLPGRGFDPGFRITRTDAHANMSCNTSSLEFDITVDNPSNQISYAFADFSNVSFGGFHTIHTARPGPALYSVVMSWNTADLLGQLGGANTITWTAGGVAHSGLMVLDGPHQLTITPPAACPSFPTLNTPLIPSIPRLIPYIQPAQPLNAVQTDTPTATAMTCAPGTYYDAASNGCLKNATNTPIPTKRLPACKKYTDEASCGAASCHWDGKTSTCGEP